jgi:hypothetical protein
MLLVPRQLKRAGMTGDVPYYGGRFTPAQAYAASHPQRQPQSPTQTQTPPQTHPDASPPSSRDNQLAALQHLLDSGVITAEEHQRLSGRVAP